MPGCSEQVVLHRIPGGDGAYWVGDSGIMVLRTVEGRLWRLQGLEDAALDWLGRTSGLEKARFKRLRDLRQALEAEAALLGPPPDYTGVTLNIRRLSAGHYQVSLPEGGAVWFRRMRNGTWSVDALTAQGREIELTSVFHSLWYAKRAVKHRLLH